MSIMTEENKIKSETVKLSSFKGYGNWGPQVLVEITMVKAHLMTMIMLTKNTATKSSKK